MIFDRGVQYIIGKIFLKDINYFHHMFKTILIWKGYMNVQSFETKQILVLGLPLGKKCHLDVAPIDSHKIYYKEGSGVSFQRLQVV
jgi:hypothetical protein